MINNGSVASAGTVREWSADEGFGVIDSADTPGGCWAHFSMIAMDGYRSLAAGQRISFTFERANQDGFNYRAITVWPSEMQP
jgi:cold shock protein